METSIQALLPLLLIAIAAAVLFSLRSLSGTGRRQTEALQQHAQKHARRFLPANEGGPAIRFAAGDQEGEARFRSGKCRFRLGRHVRVRIPLGHAGNIRLRIAPPMSSHGRRFTMMHPTPVSSHGQLPRELYDVHATCDALLHATLADGTAALLTKRHPRVWLEIKNERVEVRLAGNAEEQLVASAVALAIGMHEWVLAVTSSFPEAPVVHGVRRREMSKRSSARLGALMYIAFAAVVLTLSISFGWFADERRDMTAFVYERNAPPCGFVRGLPLIKDYIDGVPCQVWNLLPLTGLAAIAAGWLMVDLLRGSS